MRTDDGDSSGALPTILVGKDNPFVALKVHVFSLEMRILQNLSQKPQFRADTWQLFSGSSLSESVETMPEVL